MPSAKNCLTSEKARCFGCSSRAVQPTGIPAMCAFHPCPSMLFSHQCNRMVWVGMGPSRTKSSPRFRSNLNHSMISPASRREGKASFLQRCRSHLRLGQAASSWSPPRLRAEGGRGWVGAAATGCCLACGTVTARGGTWGAAEGARRGRSGPGRGGRRACSGAGDGRVAAEEAGAAAWEGDSPFLRPERRRPQRARRPWPAARRGAAGEEEADEKGLLEPWWVCQPEGEGAGEQRRG